MELIAEANHAAYIRSHAHCDGVDLHLNEDVDRIFTSSSWPGCHAVRPRFASERAAERFLAKHRKIGMASTVYVGPSAGAGTEKALEAVGYRCRIRQTLMAASTCDLADPGTAAGLSIHDTWPGLQDWPQNTVRQKAFVNGMGYMAAHDPKETWYAVYDASPNDAGSTFFKSEAAMGIHQIWVVPAKRTGTLRRDVVGTSISFAIRNSEVVTAVADKDSVPLLEGFGLRSVGTLATWVVGLGSL